jgi:mannitol/fructose-specific phosphotransferase system IIA component (Ntr-type)
MEHLDNLIRSRLIRGNILILPQSLAELSATDFVPLVQLYPGETFEAPLEDKDVPRHKASIIEWCLANALTFHDLPQDIRHRIAVSLVAREATLSCGIGKGLALPHCKTALIENPLELVLAVSPSDIEWYSADGTKTRVILTALFKANMPDAVTRRLQISVVLARMLRETGLVARIQSMRDPDQIATACSEALDEL